MIKPSKMTVGELEKVLTETKEELARRHNISKAVADIEKVLKKYNLQFADIDWTQLIKHTRSGNGIKSAQQSATSKQMQTKRVSKRDKRSSVKSKFFNPNRKEQWSGRGRTPRWVNDICERESINIKEFKLDPRFKI